MNPIRSRELLGGRRIVARDGQRMLVVDLNGTAGSVRVARRAATEFLAESAEQGATGPPDVFVADVLLVVAELVANACRHAPGPCRLSITLTHESADVAVRDTGHGHLRITQDDTPAGYGLLIVARLTDGIHVLPSGGGKVVRASVPLAGPRPTLV